MYVPHLEEMMVLKLSTYVKKSSSLAGSWRKWLENDFWKYVAILLLITHNEILNCSLFFELDRINSEVSQKNEQTIIVKISGEKRKGNKEEFIQLYIKTE